MWTKKTYSMNFYSVTASSYEELYGTEQQLKYDLVLKALGVESLGRVVDIGCGTGAFLRRISSVSTFLVGVDLSLGMLKRAKESGGSSIHFLRCDADFLPIRDDVFDYAFSFTVLQNLPSPSSTLLEILRTIHPEWGKAVITVLDGPEPLLVDLQTRGDYHPMVKELKPVSTKDRVFLFWKRVHWPK
ncbi:methyltransferase domain-containing protein [Candidatus Bathyarchaeota archaeon]|jgi:ubiquinone/menaquinone biosynthesis C-methylase UbiE|nr:methyltransferase domain-containing protein [Candidatus Bathyarchaeota archaeon]